MFWADHHAPLSFPEDHAVHTGLRPAYTLSRASIEAACQAVWLLSAPKVKECARRHLRLMRWDFEEHRKSKQGDPAGQQAVRDRDAQLLERVANRFPAAELPPASGYLNVIKAACMAEDLAVDGTEVERIWRAACGAAHGMYWPTHELQITHPLEEYEPGHFRVLQLPDADGITEALQTAYRITQYGVYKYALWAGADLDLLMRSAMVSVAERTPRRTDEGPPTPS